MPDPGYGGTDLAVGTQLDRLAAIARELGDQELAGNADAERRRLREARFFAACVGQFNAVSPRSSMRSSEMPCFRSE
jgi:hypothetical protein